MCIPSRSGSCLVHGQKRAYLPKFPKNEACRDLGRSPDVPRRPPQRLQLPALQKASRLHFRIHPSASDANRIIRLHGPANYSQMAH